MTSLVDNVGDYVPVADIGRGGMGIVTLALAPTGDVVVLKRQHDVSDDERLREEGRVGLKLDHPGIVKTLELFEHRDRPVLVLEFVSGPSLHALMAHGPVASNIIGRIGRQISEALDAIHNTNDDSGESLNIVHRDVTPGNILVGYDGNARLIDLGIASWSRSSLPRTEAGFIRGTWRYIAPETFDDGTYSATTDLWSLGIVLWEMALGHRTLPGLQLAPFVVMATEGRIMELQESDSVDAALRNVIATLLQLAPNDRPRRGQLAAGLLAAIENSPEIARRHTVELIEKRVGAQVPADTQFEEDTQALASAAARTFGATFAADEEDDWTPDVTIFMGRSAKPSQAMPLESQSDASRGGMSPSAQPPPRRPGDSSAHFDGPTTVDESIAVPISPARPALQRVGPRAESSDPHKQQAKQRAMDVDDVQTVDYSSLQRLHNPAEAGTQTAETGEVPKPGTGPPTVTAPVKALSEELDVDQLDTQVSDISAVRRRSDGFSLTFLVTALSVVAVVAFALGMLVASRG